MSVMNVFPVTLKRFSVTRRFSKQLVRNSLHCHHLIKPWTINTKVCHNFDQSSCFPFLEHRHLHSSPVTMACCKKRALVIIATGSEEIEAVTPIDVLRRAGVEVVVAGLPSAGGLILSRDVVVGAEKSLKDAIELGPYDAVILPGGGKGSEAFVESAEVGALLREQEKAGRIIGAICAAPTALHKHNICLGRKLTSYPAMMEKMMEGGKYEYSEERVVIDDILVTSRGPGTSMEFSLALATLLVGQEITLAVSKSMLFK